MSLDDEGTIEDEDRADQSARMIAVMDDDRVDTGIEVFVGDRPLVVSPGWPTLGFKSSFEHTRRSP